MVTVTAASATRGRWHDAAWWLRYRGPLMSAHLDRPGRDAAGCSSSTVPWPPSCRGKNWGDFLSLPTTKIPFRSPRCPCERCRDTAGLHQHPALLGAAPWGSASRREPRAFLPQAALQFLLCGFHNIERQGFTWHGVQTDSWGNGWFSSLRCELLHPQALWSGQRANRRPQFGPRAPPPASSGSTALCRA